MNYTQAGKLAKQIPDTPEGQLVGALCDIYDRGHQDIQRGQLKLAKLFYSDKIPLQYRLEAGVALGRTSQLMKERRALYGESADRYDHVKILETVRKMAPGSQADRDAFFYLIRERLEETRSGSDAPPSGCWKPFSAISRLTESCFAGAPSGRIRVHPAPARLQIRGQTPDGRVLRSGFANPSEKPLRAVPAGLPVL
jgi:hypothetical protein